MEKVEIGLVHYAHFRPHQALGGATPAEIYFGRTPAHLSAIPPPRGRPGGGSMDSPFRVNYDAMWRKITCMRVHEIMSRDPICCRPTDRLADVAWKMYEGDCGVLPVLGEKREAVGMITDRDVAIATTTRNKPPSEIFVAEVMSGKVHACGPDDKLERALETMAAERVRRLPVLEAGRRVIGVLSMNDVILRLGHATTHLALTRHALTALQRICEHQGGAPTASEVLGNLGRYKRTEDAVSEAALLENAERTRNEEMTKRKAKGKPARRKSPRS